jgi:hypothetical protein
VPAQSAAARLAPQLSAAASAAASDPAAVAFGRALDAFLQSPAGAAAVAVTGGTRACACARALFALFARPRALVSPL